MIYDEIGKLNVVLRILTLKNILLFSIFVFLVLIVSFFIANWIEKDKLHVISRDVILLNLSPEIRKKLRNFNAKTDNIVAIQVVSLSMKKNIRIEIYMDIEGDALNTLYKKFITERLFETPLFDSGYANNKRMIDIINGGFVCVPFEESRISTYVPAASKFIKEVCAFGIAPRTGPAGILTFYSSKKLTESDHKNIFLFARELSMEITEYNHDRNN